MPRRGNPACVCGAPKQDGRCTAQPSCTDFARPAMRRISQEARLKERERNARHGLPTRREVVVGAAKAMRRTVRGGGEATNPATLEDALASGRW